MRDERDLSGVCNKVCLEPLYTGKCKEECVKRYRKVFAVTDPASLRPKGEWISVEERLPDIISVEKAGRNTYKKSCRVLCACLQDSGKQMVKEGYYYFFNDYPSPCWKIPGTIHSVTHWMPLPEPPNTEVAHDS